MDLEHFHRISKALADPRRFELLARIGKAPEAGCAELAEEFPVAQATISHHLKELADAGLVTVRREGKYGYYSMDRATYTAYQEELARRIPSLK